jgi:hypothetical protein
MSVAKYHHINPRFVLSGFADANERIRTIRLPDRKGRTSVIERTGGENHLNSIPGHPSGADVFERALGAGIETDVANLFGRIREGEWPLPEPDRDTLAEFVALQMLRGPERRRQMESAAGELFSKAAGQLGREDFGRYASDTVGRELSEAEIDEMWALVTSPDGFTIPQTASDHIEMMGEATGEVAGFLAYRPWTLVYFGDDLSLITSDSPVSLVAHEQTGPWMGVGVRDARLVVYPVTRRLGLVMRNPFDGRNPTDDFSDMNEKARSGALDDREPGTAEIARLINACTAAHAVNNVYHHPDDAQFVPAEFQEN